MKVKVRAASAVFNNIIVLREIFGHQVQASELCGILRPGHDNNKRFSVKRMRQAFSSMNQGDSLFVSPLLLQLATGGGDVVAPVLSDKGGDSVLHENLPESLDCGI